MDKLLVKINYKTADGKHICIEVPLVVKETLEQFDRQIRSQQRQDRRYLIKEDYIDSLTDTTSVYPQEDFTDFVIRKDRQRKLYFGIETLSEVQKRRLYLHYFEEMSYREIAAAENVCLSSVAESITSAVQKLKKYFSKQLS